MKRYALFRPEICKLILERDIPVCVSFSFLNQNYARLSLPYQLGLIKKKKQKKSYIFDLK